jgi:hypothetical protein
MGANDTDHQPLCPVWVIDSPPAEDRCHRPRRAERPDGRPFDERFSLPFDERFSLDPAVDRFVLHERL